MQVERRAPFSYRDDPDVPPFPDDRPLIVFDGKCVLCSKAAQFVMRHDRGRAFRLLAAQTALGAALYRHYGLDPLRYETNILIDEGRASLRSEAVIRVLARLGFPWSMAVAARALPTALRDRLYDLVANNRIEWFGAREQCYAPQPADADRFL